MSDIISTSDGRTKRFDKKQARKLVSKIVNKYPDQIHFSAHALRELINDDLTITDILNVIKSPHSRILDNAELINGTFRYRLETSNIMVVIAFDSLTSFTIVTAWRK